MYSAGIEAADSKTTRVLPITSNITPDEILIDLFEKRKKRFSTKTLETKYFEKQ